MRTVKSDNDIVRSWMLSYADVFANLVQLCCNLRPTCLGFAFFSDLNETQVLNYLTT